MTASRAAIERHAKGRRADPGPRVLKVRLSGSPEDCAAAADQLAAWTIDRSAPYPNRRDPGVRVYLTLLIAGGTLSAATAAGKDGER